MVFAPPILLLMKIGGVVNGVPSLKCSKCQVTGKEYQISYYIIVAKFTSQENVKKRGNKMVNAKEEFLEETNWMEVHGYSAIKILMLQHAHIWDVA
jgi:hypothetical protein